MVNRFVLNGVSYHGKGAIQEIPGIIKGKGLKKAFIAVAVMLGIIAVRMILSAALSEQVAEVFTRVSCGALFFYFIILFAKNRRNAKKHETESNNHRAK